MGDQLTARERAVISNEQREKVESLHMEFRTYADAAREYDHLADLVERTGRTYSPGAHAEAVIALREMRDDAIRAKEAAKAMLQESEGWQTVRDSR
jgi:predicted RNA-binding Zn ribbon-like protein